MAKCNNTSGRRGGFRFNSIFIKLAAGIGFAAIFLTFVTSLEFGRSTIELASAELVHSAGEINGLLAENLSGAIRFADSAVIGDAIAPLTDQEHAQTLQGIAVSAEGEIVAEVGHGPALTPALTELARRAVETGAAVTSEDGLLVAHPALYRDSVVGALATAWTVDYVRAQANAAHRKVTFWAYLTVGGGILLLVVALRVWIARPMMRLACTVDHVANGDLDIEVRESRRRDELGDIGKSVETFRQQLVAGQENERKVMFRNAALEAMTASIMMVDADLTITDVNQALVELLHEHAAAMAERIPGFDPDKLIGMNIDAVHPGALKDRVRSILADPSKLPYDADINLGQVRLSLRISAIVAPDGRVVGYVNQWRDDTATYFNSAVIASIETSMMKADFDLDGTVLHVNDHFARAFGRSADDGAPWEPATRVSERMAEAFEKCRRGTADYDEYVVELPGLAPRVLDGGFTPVADRRGQIIRVTFIGKDVTEAKGRLAQAAAQREKMQAAQQGVVESLRRGLERLAEGDLTTRLETGFEAEYEQLRADFNRAVGPAPGSDPGRDRKRRADPERGQRDLDRGRRSVAADRTPGGHARRDRGRGRRVRQFRQIRRGRRFACRQPGRRSPGKRRAIR
ncbi:MAG: PAS domain-containing protein [Paracoccaceae bacterium]